MALTLTKIKLPKGHLSRPLQSGAAKVKVQKDRQRRREAVSSYERRRTLRAASKDRRLSSGERQGQRLALQGMGASGSLVRVRNRCILSGKGRGMVSKQGRLSATTLRHLARRGEVAGVQKI